MVNMCGKIFTLLCVYRSIVADLISIHVYLSMEDSSVHQTYSDFYINDGVLVPLLSHMVNVHFSLAK